MSWSLTCLKPAFALWTRLRNGFPNITPSDLGIDNANSKFPSQRPTRDSLPTREFNFIFRGLVKCVEYSIGTPDYLLTESCAAFLSPLSIEPIGNWCSFRNFRIIPTCKQRFGIFITRSWSDNSDGYIDTGDGCWRRFMLVTILRFLLPIFCIESHQHGEET